MLRNPNIRDEIIRMLAESLTPEELAGGSNIIDTSSTSAPHEAASRGDADAVRAWLRGGGNVNSEFGGKAALFAAANKGHVVVVKLLLEKGANIEATESDSGQTALDAAAFEGRVEVVKLLLEKGTTLRQPEVILGQQHLLY